MVQRVESTRVDVEPRAVADFAADYADCFQVPVGAGRGEPRDWARSALRGAEDPSGPFSRLVWQGLLGFDLAPRQAPGTLYGWRVTVEDGTAFVMEADGSRMAGRMVFTLSGGDVAWATLLRFHGLAGRLAWAAAGHAHRAVTPRCLVQAHRALAARSARDGTRPSEARPMPTAP